MKKTVTWILVADGERARILMNEGPQKGIRAALAEEFFRPVPRTRELGTERPGRVHESWDTGRHAMAPRVDWHRFEKTKFAKAMAKILDTAARRGAYDRLILVAPPKTLGDLRAALSPKCRALVTGELAKDLTPIPDSELSAHLGELLPL